MRDGIVPHIQYERPEHLLLATLVLGVLNAFLRPLLLLGCLPLLILTLGLFLLVINAGLLMLTGKLVDGFKVDGFGAAFWGTLVVSVVSLIATTLTGVSQSNFQSHPARQKKANSGYHADAYYGPGSDGCLLFFHTVAHPQCRVPPLCTCALKFVVLLF